MRPRDLRRRCDIRPAASGAPQLADEASNDACFSSPSSRSRSSASRAPCSGWHSERCSPARTDWPQHRRLVPTVGAPVRCATSSTAWRPPIACCRSPEPAARPAGPRSGSRTTRPGARGMEGSSRKRPYRGRKDEDPPAILADLRRARLTGGGRPPTRALTAARPPAGCPGSRGCPAAHQLSRTHRQSCQTPRPRSEPRGRIRLHRGPSGVRRPSGKQRCERGVCVAQIGECRRQQLAVAVRHAERVAADHAEQLEMHGRTEAPQCVLGA